jgi:SAM-dependent methyltransferase
MGKLRRIISSFLRKPVVFDNLADTNPVSRDFGLSRGIPIDRFYIESFLKSYASDVKGIVLEIAENTYTKKFDKGVTSFEILHVDNTNRKATIIGDLTNPDTLPSEKIDCFICTQTLNFIFDIQKAIEGSWKLLKNGGVFLGTVGGISQISRYDMDRWGDYWRFTDLSIRKLFENVYGKGNVEVVTFGNALAATAFLKGLAIDDFPNPQILEEKDIDYQVTIGIRGEKNDHTFN